MAFEMTPTKKSTGLGKGLGALLPSVEFSKEKGFSFKPTDDEEILEGNTAMIDISHIKQNPYQPRKDFDPRSLDDLKNSIIEHGIIQPVTVRRSVSGYELIAGERRLRAATKAGLSKIPAYIMDVVSGVSMLEMALIENVQRVDLNPIETASGYQRLIEECNYTQEQVAVRVGKDRTTITNFLRLLRLPDKIQESLRVKEMSMGHARAILACSSEKNMLYTWQQTIDKKLSVRSTEQLVKDIELGKIQIDKNGNLTSFKKQSLKKTNVKENVSPEIALTLEDSENKLRHIYKTQVKIQPKTEATGTIEFDFFSIEEFERLIDLFSSVDAKTF